MRSAPTISFDWRPSRGWRVARWTSLGIGAICLAWASLDPPAKFVLALFAVWFEWRNLHHQSLWRNSGWRLDNEGTWRWQRADGTEGDATLTQATFLGPLTVLNLRDSSGRIDLSIWPDQLDADTRRHLRVRLATLDLLERPKRAS